MNHPNTGINIFMDKLGGKWKCLILFFVSREPVRTKDFYARIPGITQKVLTDQLKQLEKDGLIRRELFPEVPPRVEYSLTELGRTFVPVLNAMCEWGYAYADAREVGDVTRCRELPGERPAEPGTGQEQAARTE